ncbi:ATP-binding protein [Fusibacter tunisiensis]|uniref:Serine/threonine-protein kinase RsbW n=1 Tax=Fusibacter tunisiensis TaxID=1008308 RepID=A0ABS2MNP2_9FIRM|nr:ATP-binding protein [Fusibacter tunisiensis]MBM7561012.1 serine/threonine-protein kinase RsbW [Fusibacter tunisiensis]
MMESVNISLPCKPEYVSVARLTASCIASQMGFDIEAIEDIKLAVGEACNNVVLHSECNPTYELALSKLEKQMIIEVLDHGKGFKFESYHAPELDQLQESGLGLFIIQSLMDTVEIKTMEGNGTKIIMRKDVE